MSALPKQKVIHIDHALVSILDACGSIQTLDEYKKLFSGKIKLVLPHEMVFSGIVDLWKPGIVDHVSYGFPKKYLGYVISETGNIKTPVFRCWKEKFQPFYVNDLQVMRRIDANWVQAATDSKIKNMVVHGVVDISGRLTSYFCLGNTPDGWSNKHCRILQVLLPGLHVALKRVLANENKKRVNGLKISKREIEIIKLLQSGKTNKQIAMVLVISENTVRNHIHNLFEKLDVKNRGQAVSKAINQKIIHV